jgi:hypothetical protein
MSIFTKKKERVTIEIDKAVAIERERRQWCIEKALYLEETRQENLTALAEKIYEYVWGARG